MSGVDEPRGSVWHRWDPHIHSPGTAMEDHFGEGAWDDYLRLIEDATPVVEALGVTDYASLDRYEEVLAHKASGRLPNVSLVFANVELRLPLLTAEGKPLNFHLLISPEDKDHLAKARSFLRKLKFSYQGENYECSREDLIRLGKKHKPDVVDETKLIEAGTNQFKVAPEVLKAALKESEWAQEHIIFGVAGGSNDGSSGLRSQDGSMEATRVEIEAMSRVIFSSQPAQRTFWAGKGAATREQLDKKWKGRKACLHGSDAHELAKVAKPDDNRYTWIKGDLTFETLRQACLEPEERVLIDEHPPGGPLDYQSIESVSILDAPWLTTSKLPLNRGLVAIIGARGSGKTALADLIAFGANAASSERTSSQSFLKRARPLLSKISVELRWADGRTSRAALASMDQEQDAPEVQYLSQQFVEKLCNADGMSVELVAEVERVVFEAHPSEDRYGTQTFQDLLALVAEPGRIKRTRAEEAGERIAERIDQERAAIQSLDRLKNDKALLEARIAADKVAREKLIVRGGETRAARLVEINNALAAAQAKIDGLKRQLSSLRALDASVRNYKDERFLQVQADLVQKHTEAGLSPEEWAAFEIDFKGNTLAIILARGKVVSAAHSALLGPEVEQPSSSPASIPPFVADSADLTTATYRALSAESSRLAQLIGLDKEKTKQLSALNLKISGAEAELQKLVERIMNAEGAAARLKDLFAQRRAAYVQVFEGFDDEQKELASLYGPLAAVLKEEGGTVGKLSFSVRRVVDAEGWAGEGEVLFDVRTSGPIRGRGGLLRLVQDELLDAWQNGDSAAVGAAMSKFRSAHDTELLAHARMAPEDPGYENWRRAVSTWLNSTAHISIQYGLKYDGVDIEQLSPGTRGIVLLLLYLSLDRTDTRPLIIDQPEENLDPKSIFDELVGRFRTTRRRRQIIIVTHNANLVVNTDADQVIVANAGPHRSNQLPKISYTMGGIENPVIRQQVCDILEGGKRAFEERAKRLRLSI
jgi:ABC-type lipoprotein export system ATPase subunit